jgi:hypothetical protein
VLSQTRSKLVKDTESHFYGALDHWKQLNLSPNFIRFAQKANPLSRSLPLLLHNWKAITDLWIEALESSDDEGLLALLEYAESNIFALLSLFSLFNQSPPKIYT